MIIELIKIYIEYDIYLILFFINFLIVWFNINRYLILKQIPVKKIKKKINWKNVLINSLTIIFLVLVLKAIAFGIIATITNINIYNKLAKKVKVLVVR